MNQRIFILGLAVVLASCAGTTTEPGPELTSWNDGPVRERIEAFVAEVTDPASPDFVPPEARIAVFDNDGTLWAERPVYFQLLFVFDRVRELASANPGWESTPPFSHVLDGDMQALGAGGYEALFQLVDATHAGMDTAEFDARVRDWLSTARHPDTGRAYTEMVYQPMLEMIDYLAHNGFTVWIVSGGGQEFLRTWAEHVYGIPPERVVGSYGNLEYEVAAGEPVLVKRPGIAFIDDKEGKPVAIHRFIGRRPILAVGNSDGDFQMLEYVTAGDGARLGVLIHHTDGEREWAYDRDTHVGRLERGLDEAEARGWLVVDMARDWGAVFPD